MTNCWEKINVVRTNVVARRERRREGNHSPGLYIFGRKHSDELNRLWHGRDCGPRVYAAS